MVQVNDMLHQVVNEPDLEGRMSDDMLVKGALQGDESAFEELFLRHRTRIRQIAGRFFPRREWIEDVVQEIFTKLFFVLGEYSVTQGGSFAAWLSRIAMNVCYDQLRHLRRRPEGSLQEITPDEADWIRRRIHSQPSVGNVESAVISRDLVHKLLVRLDPEDQLVLTLLESEELSVVEIAEVTGWSVSKVKVRAHRARLALRRVLHEFS